jgi:hypothetical protein
MYPLPNQGGIRGLIRNIMIFYKSQPFPAGFCIKYPHLQNHNPRQYSPSILPTVL